MKNQRRKPMADPDKVADQFLDDQLNLVIASLRGTKAASILADAVGGGIERLRAQLESEQALTRKLTAEYSASRVGIMATQGELHEHLALMIHYLAEEAKDGDGIREEHSDGFEAAKLVLSRTRRDAPQWENAQIEISDLIHRASQIPGLSADLDQVRYERDEALRKLREAAEREAAK